MHSSLPNTSLPSELQEDKEEHPLQDYSNTSLPSELQEDKEEHPLQDYSNTSLPSELQEDKEEHPLQDYSTLPREECWGGLRNYQGFWLPEIHLHGFIALRQRFKARPTDIFLASSPKSGSTWLKALIFATMTRANYSLSQDHPLLSLNPHNCVLHIDEYFSVGQASQIEEQPSPRLLSTHIPYSFLPDSIKSSQCRIIYVCREPKDVLVSMWHFSNAIGSYYKKEANSTISFAKAFGLFCNGRTHFGPLWDHVLEYWRESLQRPDKVLFLKYEEILKEPAEKVRRLAEFLGCPFSPEEEKEGVVEDIAQLCSFERLSKTEMNKTGDQASAYGIPNSIYFRKGEAGDWANHMSPEMAQRLDQVIKEKIKDTGLTLGGVCLDAGTSSDI